MTENSFCNCIR